MKRRLVQLLASLAIVTLAGFAFAGQATDLVKSKQTQMFTLLNAGGADSDKKIAAIFDDMLDYDSVIAGALGTTGTSKCTAEEQKTISDDMKKLIQKAWKGSLKRTLNYTIDYTGEVASGSDTIVQTVAKPQSGGDTIEVNYKMKMIGGKLKVTDIQTETVWTVENWRTSFAKIINKDGCGALIKKLSDKLAAP